MALAAALLLWAGVGRALAVTVRYSAELGRQSEAALRPKALESGLATAVSLVAARHTDSGQRAEMNAQLRAVLAKARHFVTKYAVEAESAEGGIFKVRYHAEVDRESLLSALEGAGLKVFRLETLPRVLVAPSAAGYSATGAKGVAALFRAEGIEAALYDQSAESPESFCKIALAKGYHLALVVSLSEPPPPEPAEGGETGPPAPPPVLAPGEEPPPARFELAASANLYDARTGESLGRSELASVAEAPSAEEAVAEATDRGAEELFESVMGSLMKSGWKLGDKLEALRISIGSVESPALAQELTALFASTAEFRKVELYSIGAKTAVWSVRAVNPGNDWLPVLARIRPSRGVIRWKALQAAQGGPLPIEGYWQPR